MNLFDLPDISWADLTLPDVPFPDLPLPDLPGSALQWIILFPVLAALLGVLVVGRSNRFAAWIAGIGSFGAVAAALTQLARMAGPEGGDRTTHTVGRLPFGELDVPLTLAVTWPMAFIAATVALVAMIVQGYARWYLWYDPRYRTFAATVSLFTAGMLLTVLSDDILLTIVGWEVMGWCSFLLIGHHSTRPGARRAATKALLVTRVADLGMILGLVILAAQAGTTRISEITDHVVLAARAHGEPGGAMTLAMLLVVIGVAGKSALFPFQDWLPDAMEGPTPASALIHAATMVAAGTVVLIHLFEVLAVVDEARLLLAVLASITMLGAALLAFVQGDLKRLLAWSTVSQVALMLGALAAATPVTGPDAAATHLIAHAWFKALLFLTAGWLGVLVGGTAMAVVASGAKRYRVLRRRFAWGLLALAGVPPFVGFVSKELVLSTAETGAGAGGLPAVLVLGAVGAAAPLTAAYCMRAWLVLSRPTTVQERATYYDYGPVDRIDDFFDEPQVVQEAEGVERAESAISSTARMGTSFLLLMSIFGGALFLLPVWRHDTTIDLQLMAATLLFMVVAAVAVALAARGVRTRDAAARVPAGPTLAGERGLGFDYLYRLVIATPVLALARVVTRFDRDVLDGWVSGIGAAPALLGRLGDRVATRRATPGLALVLGGMLLLALIGVVSS